MCNRFKKKKKIGRDLKQQKTHLKKKNYRFTGDYKMDRKFSGTRHLIPSNGYTLYNYSIIQH